MITLATEIIPENNHYVYMHIDKVTNIPFYIGRGGTNKQEKKKQYFRACFDKTSRSPEWHAIADTNGYNIKILVHCETIEKCYEKEIEFIKLYGRQNLGEGSLVNKSDGGDSCKGYIMPDSAKKAIAKAMALNNPNFGGKHGIGRRHSEESKQKMSEIRKGKRWSKAPIKKVLQYDKNMVFLKEWESTKEINEFFGKKRSHISQVCSGKRAICYGYIWKYKI